MMSARPGVGLRARPGVFLVAAADLWPAEDIGSDGLTAEAQNRRAQARAREES